MTVAERLAFLEQQQAIDRSALETLRRQEERVRLNILVRSGRIEELKRLAQEEKAVG